MKRFSLLLLLPLILGSLAAADDLSTYGDTTVVTGPDGNPAWQLASVASGAGYAGVYVSFTGLITPATLNQLSADYVMETGTFGGGAPRFTILDTTAAEGAAYVYWGTPQPGGTFTDPNQGNTTYANTGNYADVASPDLRVQNNGFGGDSTGASYETWSQFVAMDGAVPMAYLTIDLDGGFTGDQVMDMTDFDINGTVYTPNGTQSSTPEPASVALMGAGLAAVGGFALRRKK